MKEMKAKIVYMALALVLVFSLAAVVVPASPVLAAGALQDGGTRLVAMQNDDGGWDWPLDNGNPATGSEQNTIGPIGKGLAEAYKVTGDAAMLTALGDVAAFLQVKTNTFSPSDGYLAAELDSIFGGTTNVLHVNTYFYGPLAAGTYDRNGLGTTYNTSEYVNLVRTLRANAGIANLAAWDIGMGLVGAASAGVTGAELDLWIEGVKAEIDELDGTAYYDVIGLAGAVYGLAFVGEDFDPTAGEHAAASDLNDLADILASYQIAESGGFTWNSEYVIPYEDNETIQETAYAILALAEVGGYSDVTGSAVCYTKSVQLGTGGWENYTLSGENNEITGEALWAIAVAPTVLLYISPASQTVSPGQVFTVDVYVEPAEPIKGTSVGLSFDPALLTADSCVEGDLLPPFPSGFFFPGIIDNVAGTISGIDGAALVGTVSGPGAFATINFTAGETTGTSTLDLSDVIVRDADNQPVVTDVTGGSVTIEEEGNGGCFIATAAYGTEAAEEIDVLRAFRDEVLLESTVGSQLVELYYQTSPPVADFISENSLLRTIVREMVIDPMVSVATFTQGIWGK
jgi:hypothetical protein